MRANPCLSIEYCPGKKKFRVKGENNIWTPPNLCHPQVLDGSVSQLAPASQAEPFPPARAGWGCMEKAEEPVMLPEDNKTEATKAHSHQSTGLVTPGCKHWHPGHSMAAGTEGRWVRSCPSSAPGNSSTTPHLHQMR